MDNDGSGYIDKAAFRVFCIGIAIVGILLVAMLLSHLRDANAAEPERAAFGATTDAAYYYPPGTVLAWKVWVLGHGGNQYGHWFDGADVMTQSMPSGKSVRFYTPANLATYKKYTSVDVIGKIIVKGQIKVLRATVDYQNQFPIMPKVRLAEPAKVKQPAQE